MMRYRSLLCFVLCVIFIAPAFGQSGRRVRPAVSEPAQAAEPSPAYSESVPRKTPPSQSFETFRGVGGDTIIPSRTDSDQVDDRTAAERNSVDEEDEEIVSVDTNFISIPVSVYDRNGIFLSNLRREEMKIFENGKEQEISFFDKSEKPFTVVLLIDTSPSANYKMEEIHQAAISFVDQLRPEDKVIVIEFDQRVRVHTRATSNKEAIRRGIRQARFGAGTSLYTAVEHTITRELDKIQGRKAVVLFTDGVDTTSRRANYDNTLALADRSDIMFFPVYYNTFLETRRGARGGLLTGGTTAGEYAVGKKYLEELAEYTGGRVFEAESSYNSLERAFAGIAEELRSQYVIGYVPNEDGIKGERRQIRVRIYRPDLTIRARDSYIVGVAMN